MRRILLFSLLLVFSAIMVFIFRIQFYPFGYKAVAVTQGERLNDCLVRNMPNTSIYSYRVNVGIKNKEDFISFLKENTDTHKDGSYIDSIRYELGSFMDKDNKVDWRKVYESVKVRRLAWKKVYSLSYKTLDPCCNVYKLEVTSDGYILDYRSAGK